MVAKSSLKCGLFSLSIAAISAVCASNAFGASSLSMVSADQAGGYAHEVMESVLPYWQTPTEKMTQPLRIVLTIDAKGVLERCKVVRSSGTLALDVAACKSAKQASPFVAPASGTKEDVYVAFWTGENTALIAKKESSVATSPEVENMESLTESKGVTAENLAASESVKPEPAKHDDRTSELKTQEPQGASSLAQEKLTQARVVEDSVSASKAEGVTKLENTPAQKRAESARATQKAEGSSSQHSDASIKNSPQHMVHAGIDYSKPRPTPAGVQPLASGLVGVTLPPQTEEDATVTLEEPPVHTPKRTVTPPKKSPSDDLSISLDADKDSLKKGEPPVDSGEPLRKEEIEAKPYAKGKTPFIQDNRRGQIMDELDFYVLNIIRKAAAMVKYPLGLKPGVISASLNCHITAGGTITGVEISSSSRNKALDAALLEATRKVTGLPPHPTGEPQTLFLIFMVETPY